MPPRSEVPVLQRETLLSILWRGWTPPPSFRTQQGLSPSAEVLMRVAPPPLPHSPVSGE